MSDLNVELDVVVEMVRGLSTLDKVRLVKEVLTLLEGDLTEQKSGPKRSLYGIWPKSGISEEDIAQVRREMFNV